MLEQSSWIATIVGTIIAAIGLTAVVVVKNRSKSKQISKIKGSHNSVTQTTNTGRDSDKK